MVTRSVGPVAGVLLSSLITCSRGADSPPPAPPPPPVSVQVFPGAVAIAPLDTYPFSAYVTGADQAVAWSVTSGGGTIGEDGRYTAPAGTGTFEVVASASGSSASGKSRITITPSPPYVTGPQIGVNLSWWAYWDSQAFADTARQGDFRRPDNSLLANTDALGWPAEDFVVYVGVHASGDYTFRFDGSATINYGAVATTYDATTNTSSGKYTIVTPPTGGFVGFTFRETRRVAGGPSNAGVSNLKIMRPGRDPDDRSAAKRFEPAYVAAVQGFQWFRPMQTFGTSGSGVCGNSDAHWSDADAIEAGVPAYQAGATYSYGDKVISNGKVYLATFPLVDNQTLQSGVAGGTPPNHHKKGAFSETPPPADGSVYWRRAARVLPHGCADSGSGPAWEDLVLLANRSRVAPWFTIPYFATDLYVTKLARLIKYGSDANGEPYTSAQANPVNEPLHPSLPFIVEWSNEIWNGIAPYPSRYHDPLTEAAFRSGNPWRLTSSNYYERGIQSSAALAARMSLLFRQVFGDEMMTRCRPVWAGQLGRSSGYAGAAAGVALTYLDDVWNDTSNPTVNGYAAGQPPSYYLYGVAGAPYNHWVGANLTELFASWAANLESPIRPRLEAWDQWASEFGVKTLMYEGGNETTSELITQAQMDERYTQALVDLTHAFWSTPRGTADVYVHFRMDSSANNTSLGAPARAPYGSGDYVATQQRTIVARDTPGWKAMRLLRAEADQRIAASQAASP